MEKTAPYSPITFEKISSIKPLEPQHVYDLSIEGTRNFIANDIIAHNTARYLQYKADFNTTDPKLTPILNDVTLNFTGILTNYLGDYNYTLTTSNYGARAIRVNTTFEDTLGDEKSATLSVVALPVINTNITVPTYPMYNRNVTIIANVTDANNNIKFINFTLIAPNGTRINLTNGSRVGDLHNSSFNLTSYGTWKWNVSVYDNDGFVVNMSGTGEIILMELQANLNASAVFANAHVAVSGKVNLSNGTNVSNTRVRIFVDSTEEGLNRYFIDDNATDFNKGIYNSTQTDSQNVTLAFSNLTANLTGYWKLDNTTNVSTDSSGNGNDLRLNTTGGSFHNQTGKINPSANFTRGASDTGYSLSIPNNPSLNGSNGSFTIAGWYYGDTFTSASCNILASKGGTTTREWYFGYCLGDAAVRFSISGDGTNPTQLNANSFGALSTKTWYFLAAWWDKSNGTAYIQVNNGPIDSVAHYGVFYGATDFTIGAIGDSPRGYHMDGRIDEVGFWKRALTAKERQDLMNNGYGITWPFNYSSSGNFTQTYDALGNTTWSYITWANVTPANTSLIISTRTSDDNITWRNWINHTASPSLIWANNTGRYLQYLATFNTTNASVTPYLLNVSINYSGIFTDSFGNYNYTLTSPSTPGIYSVKVNSTWADTIPGEALQLFRVMSVPVINNNYTVPTYPRFNQNVTLVVNVTDADPTIVYVNFTLVAPNGTKVINNTNGSRMTGDLYNTTFNLTSYGTWLWNVTVFDSDGFIVNTTTISIILMQITESLNMSVALVGSPVGVSGHMNLSNGTNVSNNEIGIFIDGTRFGFNNLTPFGNYVAKQFIDTNSSDFNAGTGLNVTAYGVDSTANLTLNRNISISYPNATGNFTSRMFNASTIVNWTYISWSDFAQNKYGVDLSDSINASTVLYMKFDNATLESERQLNVTYNISNEVNLVLYMPFDSANAEELTPNGSTVLLLHFNNDTGTGENASLFLSNATFSNGTGIVNGSCNLASNLCPVINESSKAFGRAGIGFDGTNDFVNITNNANFDFGSKDFVMELWANFDAVNGERTLLSKTQGSTGWVFLLATTGDTGNVMSLALYHANQAGALVYAPFNAQTGKWYHLAAVREGGNIKFYADGALIGTGSANPTYNGAAIDVQAGVYDPLSGDFDGNMDEIAIWNVSLTSEIIAKHSGYGIDKSIYGNNASALVNLTVNQSCKFNECMMFGNPPSASTANTDYVEFTSDTGLAGMYALTLEAWIKMDGTSTVSQRIFNHGTNDYIFSVDDNNNQVSLTLNNDAAISTSNNAIRVGEWAHVAATWRNVTNDTYVYVNGVVMGSGRLNQGKVLDTGCGILRIGQRACSPGLGWNGSIDEVAIWNISLTPDKIAEHAGAKVVDYSIYGNNGTRNFNSASDFGRNYTDGKFSKALVFDGVNDYVNVTNITQITTVEMWTNTTEGWQHLANVSGTTYKNGVQQNINLPFNNRTGYFVIGQYTDSTFFYGTIDELSIWNISLEADTIKQHAMRGLTNLSIFYSVSNDSTTWSNWQQAYNSTLSTIGFSITDDSLIDVVEGVVVEKKDHPAISKLNLLDFSVLTLNNLETSKPSSFNVIKSPSKSSGFDLDLSNKENDLSKVSGLSCGTLSQTTENILSFGNFKESVKCSSLDTNILCSDFENAANSPLERPFGLKVTSHPSDLRNPSNSFFTFSSRRNLSTLPLDADDNIVTTFCHDACVMQGCLDLLSSEGGNKIVHNLFDRDPSFEQLKDLPDHYSGAFESGLSMADFAVRDNVLVDFDSHDANNENGIFKGYADSYTIIPINEFKQLCPSLDCNVADYITVKKKIKDIVEGDIVLSLDEKTGKIVSNKVNALVDHGVKPIRELKTESGRAINTTAEHPYLVKLYSKEECDKYENTFWNNKSNFNDENSLTEKSINGKNNQKGGNSLIALATTRQMQSECNEDCSRSILHPPVAVEQESATALLLNKLIEAEGGGERNVIDEEQSSSIPPKELKVIENGIDVNENVDNEFKNKGYCTRWVEVSDLEEGMEIAVPKLENVPGLLVSNASERTRSHVTVKSSLKSLEFPPVLPQNKASLVRLSEEDKLAHGTSSEMENYEYKSFDIEFEKIKSITPLPSQHVYDLSIEGTRNFIANDIIAHNTAKHFRYLAKFNTSNGNLTPILHDVTVNYTGIFTDSFGNYNYTFSSPLAAGTYTVKVNSTWDNTIPGEQTATLSVENNQAPNAPILNAPANNSYINVNYTILNITLSDNNTFAQTFRCYFYGENSTLPNSTINSSNPVTLNGSAITFNWTNLNNSVYYWKASCDDNVINQNGSNSTIINFTIDTIQPGINFTATLSNNTFIDQNFITVNITLTELNFANVTYYLYNGSTESIVLYNETNFTTRNLFINFTDLNKRERSYLINVTARDKAGNINSTETRNITLDSIFPQVNFTSPTPANDSRAKGNVQKINISIRDVSIRSCVLQVFNGTDNATNYTMEVRGLNCNVTINTLDGYNYTLKAYVNDSALHGNYSENISFRENTKPEVPTLNAPANNSRLTVTSLILNYTSQDNDTDSISYVVYFDTNTNPGTSVYSGASQTFVVSAARGSTYYWKVHADDTFENSSNSTIRQFTINTPPPPQNITTPNSTGIKLRGGQTYNISWINVSDAESDNITINLFYSTDSGVTYPNTITSGLKNNGTYDWLVPSINGNKIRIKAIANDSYEFTQDESDNDFTVDSNAPVITLDNPPNMSLFNNGTFINLTITDNLAGVSNVSWNNGSFNAPNRTDFNGTYDINTTGWGVGEVNISVFANDSVGNFISAYFRFNVTAEQAVIIYNAPTPNQVIRATFRINVSSTSQLDDVAFVNFTYDGATQNFTMTQAGNDYFYDFDTTTVSDGQRRLSVYGNNSNGNIVRADIFATIDNTRPAIRLDNPLNDTWKNGSVNFVYVPNDNTTISSCSLVINSTINQTNNSITRGIENLFSNVALGSGVFRWDVNCTDAAANNGTNGTFRLIKTDLIKPAITLLDPPNESAIRANYSINFSVTDSGGAGVYNVSWSSNYVLDSMVFIGSYAINTSDFPEGATNFTITANDSAGNTLSKTFVFTIDNTPPIITFNTPSVRQVVRGIFRVNITGTDQLSSVSNVTFDFNGSTNSTMSRATLPSNDYFFDWNTTNGTDKEYIIKIYGNDTATPPNVKFVSRLAIVDNTPPAVRLDSPSNNTWSNTKLNTFTFGVFEVNNLQNCTLLINGSVNATITSLFKNSTNTFTVNLSDGNYRWTANCSDEAVDTNGTRNIGTNSSEYLINVDTSNPTITFISPHTESNDTHFARNFTAINITFTEPNFANVTFYLYNQTALINETNFTSITYFINFTDLKNDLYFYNVTVRDRAGNINSTGTMQISLNTRAPSANRLRVTNSSGSNIASIDSKGDMYIMGNKTQSLTGLSPAPNSFIVQNSSGNTITYINSTGYLFMKGTLTEDSDIITTGTNLEIRDSSDIIVAIIDNKGNIKLRGLLVENYNSP